MAETILDLGCGAGLGPGYFGVTESDRVVGADVDRERVRIASLSFPHRYYFVSRAEALSLAGEQFPWVIANMSLPYMDIPKALAEIYRVLVPGGKVSLTIHPPSFTLAELKSARSPKAVLGRMYVLLNGIVFYLSGRSFAAPFSERVESFQTKRGMRLALIHCGFTHIRFGTLGPRFLAEASKPENMESSPDVCRRIGGFDAQSM
jgi:ubiquinone/menaquinone biosynthesis C-methylase UbiE